MPVDGGPIITLVKLIYQIYQSWRDAPASFKSILTETELLRINLEKIKEWLPAQQLSDNDRRGLEKHLDSCNEVLTDLKKTLDKIKSSKSEDECDDMTTLERILWEEQLARDLRSRLTSNMTLLNGFIQ